MKKKFICSFALITAVMLGACGETEEHPVQDSVVTESAVEVTEEKIDTKEDLIRTEEEKAKEDIATGENAETEEITASEVKEEESMKDPVVLYMGHASMRIVTGEDKVIYIDPFCGDGYDMAADMILQTHDHYDHKDLSKIGKRNDDCVVITQKEALAGGTHQKFDTGYVQVEAVEAGYNKNHNVNSCVGYILTFGNGVSLYVSGDTSKTQQMAELGSKGLDYAFYCCDGVYNMDAAEASECAALVGAKVNIPYHSGPADKTLFDIDNAKKFDAPGAFILMPGMELMLEKQ